MNVITKTVQLPDGRTISIETGKVAKQADGSAVADNETFTEEVLRRNDRLIRSMLRRL